MSDAVTIRLDEQRVPARLVVTGEIDLDTAERFHQAVEFAAARPDPVVVDLTAVTFLGSEGIHALLRYRERLSSVVVLADSIVARALQITGYPSLVTAGARGAV